MSKQFYIKQFSLAWVQFSSIWPIDRTLSSATTPGQSGPENDGNEEVLRIPQTSCSTGTLPSDCLVSYSAHLLGEGLTPLQRNRQCILQSKPTGQKLLCVI